MNKNSDTKNIKTRARKRRKRPINQTTNNIIEQHEDMSQSRIAIRLHGDEPLNRPLFVTHNEWRALSSHNNNNKNLQCRLKDMDKHKQQVEDCLILISTEEEEQQQQKV